MLTAQAEPTEPRADALAAMEAALKSVQASKIVGPAPIKLLGQAQYIYFNDFVEWYLGMRPAKRDAAA